MKKFEYIIKDANGIHARPAGMLVKEASKFESVITIESGEKKADAKKIFAVMSMNVKCGDKLSVLIEGSDEEKAQKVLFEFFNSNL